MVEDTETYRLAQAALSEAKDARHIAEMGSQAMSSHEKICSERYDNINKSLGHLPELFASIADVRVKQAEALALNRAIAVISVGIGILYTILKLTGHSAS